MRKIQNIFVENVNMETQTIYNTNGSINIHPCEFECGQHIIAGLGDQVSQKGRMTTDEDGTSRFMPYAKDSGSRYCRLMQTAHGDVKECLSTIIFTLRFPKQMHQHDIERFFADETAQMAAFLALNRIDADW